MALTHRYIAKLRLEGATPNRIDRMLDAEHYFDLFGSWNVTDMANVRLGINNVLDEDPSINASVGTTGNGNTYPAGVRRPGSLHLRRRDGQVLSIEPTGNESITWRRSSRSRRFFFGSSPISGVSAAGSRSPLLTWCYQALRRQEGDRGPRPSYFPAGRLGRLRGDAGADRGSSEPDVVRDPTGPEARAAALLQRMWSIYRKGPRA